MGAVPGRRRIWPVKRMLPCMWLSNHSRQPAARKEENTTFGSVNSAGTTSGLGISLEHSSSTMAWPSETLKASEMLTKSKSI